MSESDRSNDDDPISISINNSESKHPIPSPKTHPTISHNKRHKTGRQTSEVMLAVAGYEVVKGIGAVGAAIALIIWHDRLIDWLAMLDATWGEQFGSILAPPIASSIRIAQRASQNWVLFLLLIIGYGSLRFLQAYGLFKDKTWAYWLGIFGYAILVPVEVYYLLTRPFDWLKLGVLIINCYVVFAVFTQMKRKGLI